MDTSTNFRSIITPKRGLRMAVGRFCDTLKQLPVDYFKIVIKAVVQK